MRLYVLASEIAHYIHCPSLFEVTLQLMPSAWQILRMSNPAKGETLEAIAFINKDSKEVLCAYKGLDPYRIPDIKDAAYLIVGSIPSRASTAVKSFNCKVIEMLKSQAPDDFAQYHFSTTGHSLGSIFAATSSIDFLKFTVSVDKCVMFDPPGVGKFIDQMISIELERGEALDLSHIKYEALLALPNFVNCAHLQDSSYANVNVKVIIQDQGPMSHDFSIPRLICYYIAKPFAALIDFSRGTNISHNLLDNLCRLEKEVESHRLKYFWDFIEKKQGVALELKTPKDFGIGKNCRSIVVERKSHQTDLDLIRSEDSLLSLASQSKYIEIDTATVPYSTLTELLGESALYQEL